MKMKDDFKVLMIKAGFSMTDLAKALSEKTGKPESVQNINGKLTRETLRYKEALEIADIMGYEIQWVQKK